MSLSYDQLFPGRFIKAGEMNGRPVTLTIKDVFLDTLETETGAEESKPLLSFEETARQWVLIKTNAQCLLAMWGPDTADWIGRRVTLYPEKDASGLSDSGLCIRVKGSPDLVADITATIKLPRRKPQTRKLVRTGKAPRTKDDDIGFGDEPPVDVDTTTGEMFSDDTD